MEFISTPKQYIDAVEQAAASVGQSVSFRGTVHRVRDMSDFAFVVVRVNRGLIQCMFSGEIDGMTKADIKDGMVVEVAGNVREEPRAEHGFEVVLTAEYMLSQSFTHIHTPKIVSAGAEGGANIFKLDYFGQQAYLAQSPQFYKQYTAGIFGRVFEIGNVYRAERHNTSRHLNEYIGRSFEMAYIDSMFDVMEMETGMLKYVIAYVQEHCKEELDMLGTKLPVIDKIPTVTFTEAKEIMLEKYGHKSKNRYDLNPDEEVMMCQWAQENYGSEFVFVTHFPSAKRPFYAMDDPENPKYALSFDLLFRGLEITTGGQRIHDYYEQVKKLEDRKMDVSLFESFLMMHKYGMPPHGGLGIGLERLTMQLLGLKNIREASMFPRDMTRLVP